LVLFMSGSLFDQAGIRKYLVTRERLAFVRAAFAEGGEVGTFCLALAFTGARISEVLALTVDRVDAANGAIVFETLKQRKKGVFRSVPAPNRLLSLLVRGHPISGERIWPWGRTAAWKYVKRVMRKAKIAEGLCKPKSLRHAFAVEAGQQGVPLNIVQRWLGHARIETTAIYSAALGDEERKLAKKVWQTLEIESVLGTAVYLSTSK
jgi:integrase/recombinase XerD